MICPVISKNKLRAETSGGYTTTISRIADIVSRKQAQKSH